MREPTRGLGRALGLGTLLCVVLYVAINTIYLRALPLATLAASTDPARASAIRLGGDAVGRLLSPLVAICVLSSLQATVLVGPRIYQAMAVDGLFFAPLGRTHARAGTPVVALVVQGVVATALLVAGSLGSLDRRFDRVFDQLLTFTMSAIVAFSTLAVAAVIVLRVRRPDAPRPFRVPGYPFVPALFVVVNVWLLWSELEYADRQVSKGEGRIGLFASLAIMAAGLPAYFAFRHGRAKQGEKAFQ
jgi:APA family basic amino acid/polyamine antiporter